MDWGSFWVASFRPPLGSPIQHPLDVTHYRIITPAKPPEPEMAKTAQEHAAAMFATAIKPEPDLITLRLECLKLALQESSGTDYQRTADIFLHYVLNGSVDKA
jgi:hypothetical protein